VAVGVDRVHPRTQASLKTCGLDDRARAHWAVTKTIVKTLSPVSLWFGHGTCDFGVTVSTRLLSSPSTVLPRLHSFMLGLLQ
jgi:hypothetical protein